MFSLFLMVLFGDAGLIELNRLSKIHEEFVEGNALLAKENIEMSRSIDRLQNDPAYVESIARKLGMVGPKEVIFTFKKDANNP